MLFFMLGNELRSKANDTSPVVEVPFKVINDEGGRANSHSMTIPDIKTSLFNIKSHHRFQSIDLRNSKSIGRLP